MLLMPLVPHTNHMTDHPISPPPELVEQWRREPEYAYDTQPKTMVTMTTDRLMLLSKKSAQYGADQELEACCEWLDAGLRTPYVAIRLRSDRRSKPPSLKEQALEVVTGLEKRWDLQCDLACLRRALEALPND